MNIKKCLMILVMAVSVHAGQLLAGTENTITGGSGSGQAGGTASFNVAWVDNPGDLTEGLEFYVYFDTASFSFSGCTFNPPWDSYFFKACTLQGNRIQVGLARLPTGNIENSSVDMEFNILGGTAPGSYPFTIPSDEVVTTNDLDPTTTTDASINVLGPSYDSVNPTPGGTFAFGSHTAGDPDPTITMTIDNDGETGTTLNGSCSVGGANPTAFGISGTPWSVPEAGPNADVVVSCDSSALTPGSYSAIISCPHDGDGSPASPVGYTATCDIVAAPAPALGSSPQSPGQTIDFGGPFVTSDPNPTASLDITNSGNLDGLTGSCSISNNAGGVFSLAGDPVAINLDQADPAVTLDLTCDVDAANPATHMGTLTCTHNGSNGPTSSWPLTCAVDATPAYDSTPADGNPLPAMNGTQGNTDPTTSLSISNVGEPGSTLNGTCGLSGDAEISISGSAAFSVAQGGPAGQITVQCDATAQGGYTSTLSCTSDDPNQEGPATYGVTCAIGAPDPAIYSSIPSAGSPINLTPGEAVVEGTDLTNAASLTISNAAAPGDDYLDLQGCALDNGAGPITASPVTANDDLDPGQNVVVQFSCDTTTDGNYTDTYRCPYLENPSNIINGAEGGTMPGEATYLVSCDVRDPYSEVEETPPSGTPQTAELMPGESTTFSFTFDEIVDEGLDATLDDCSVTGPDFAITAPGSFPQPIPSGGSLQVDVTFTDPGVGDTFTDTLNCTYTDNPEPEGGTLVSWPLEVTVVGRNATFTVTKDFDDNNPMGVEVTLECNTGLPLQQTGTVHDPDATLSPGQFTELEFVVVDFNPGDMDCDISETVPVGYDQSYFADFGDDGVANAVFDDADGCHYEGIESADFVCEITNELDLVEIVVNKEWIDDNPGYDLPTIVDITIHCNAPVFGIGLPIEVDSGNQTNGSYYTWSQFIDPTFPGVFGIYPDWDGSTECFVTEEPEAGVEADVSDCADISVAPGVGAECTVVNTRLYAGIPTLSQYGLMLMALLMLGVGAVAFRRYS